MDGAVATREVGPTRRRLNGVDLARGAAIVGMLARHVGPVPREEPIASLGWFYTRAEGRAAVLFVLVAGVGIALLASRRDARWVRARLLYRTLWLLPVGLLLMRLDSGIATILAYYAIYFLILVPFVAVRDRTLLLWAGALGVVGPAARLTIRVFAPEMITSLGGTSSNGVLHFLVTGVYPAVTFIPPMLLGMWLGRRLLRASARGDGDVRRLALQLVVVGAAAVATVTAITVLLRTAGVQPMPRGWSFAWTASAHTEMPLALITATGGAIAVLGLSLLVADRFPRATWPGTAFGRLALTIYVGHVIAFAALPGRLEAATVPGGIAIVTAITLVGTVTAVLWLRVLPRGPLESLDHGGFQRLIVPLLERPDADDEPARTGAPPGTAGDRG